MQVSVDPAQVPGPTQYLRRKMIGEYVAIIEDETKL